MEVIVHSALAVVKPVSGLRALLVSPVLQHMAGLVIHVIYHVLLVPSSTAVIVLLVTLHVQPALPHHPQPVLPAVVHMDSQMAPVSTHVLLDSTKLLINAWLATLCAYSVQEPQPLVLPALLLELIWLTFLVQHAIKHVLIQHIQILMEVLDPIYVCHVMLLVHRVLVHSYHNVNLVPLVSN